MLWRKKKQQAKQQQVQQQQDNGYGGIQVPSWYHEPETQPEDLNETNYQEQYDMLAMAEKERADNLNTINNSNIFPSNQICTMGVSSGETLYNYSKSHINFDYLMARTSSNYVLTMRPYLLDRFIKDVAIAKRVAEIPVADAIAGLAIKTSDNRINENTLAEINSIISRKKNVIQEALVNSEIYGANYIFVAGDANKLSQPIGVNTNKDNLVIASRSYRDIYNITRQDVFFFKEAPLMKYGGDETVSVGGIRWNKNRVVLCTSTDKPAVGSVYEKMLRGYGYSVFEKLKSCLYEVIIGLESSIDMMRNQSVNCLGIKGLAEQLRNPNACDLVKKSIKGLYNFIFRKFMTDDFLVKDADDTFDRQSNNFDLQKTINGLAELFAFETGIPVARLLGEKDASLAGTGVNSTERQYSQLLDKIRSNYYSSLFALITKIIEAVYGIEKPQFEIIFEPQMVVSEREKLDNQLLQTQIYQNALSVGVRAEDIISDMQQKDIIASTNTTEDDLEGEGDLEGGEDANFSLNTGNNEDI